jgi:hypothetical protein
MLREPIFHSEVDLATDLDTSHLDVLDVVSLQSSKESQQQQLLQNELMREELHAYLEQLNDKKGSDGELLVKVPSNFSLIVSSMNREDLHDDDNQDSENRRVDDRSWSRHLLLDGLMSDEVVGNEYDGRYRHLFSSSDTPVEKIKIGLAQIQLLDRQLSEVTRKSNTFLQQKQSDVNRTRQAGGMLFDGNAPSAYDGVAIDETFMTKERLQSRTADTNSVIYSEEGIDHREIDFGSSADVSMTGDDQSRLDALLIGDGEDLSFLGPYFDPELQKANEEVDVKLLSYDRMERLKISDKDELLQFDSNEQAGRPADYLGEQRQKRAIRRHISKIDALIEACKDTIVHHPDSATIERPTKVVDVVPAISDVLARGVTQFILSDREVTSLVQSITTALQGYKNRNDGSTEDVLSEEPIRQLNMVGLTCAEQIRINKLLQDCRAQIEGIKKQKAATNSQSPCDVKNATDSNHAPLLGSDKLLDFNESVPLVVLNAYHSAVDTSKMRGIGPSELLLPSIPPNKVKQSCRQNQPLKASRNTKLADPAPTIASPCQQQRELLNLPFRRTAEGSVNGYETIPLTIFRSTNILRSNHQDDATLYSSQQLKRRMKEQQISNILIGVPAVVSEVGDNDVIVDRRDKKKSTGVKSMRI